MFDSIQIALESMLLSAAPFGGRRYELCLADAPHPVDELYYSRAAAERRMYDICGKRGLQIKKVYPDKHFKTYICDNGATFHINRM